MAEQQEQREILWKKQIGSITVVASRIRGIIEIDATTIIRATSTYTAVEAETSTSDIEQFHTQRALQRLKDGVEKLLNEMHS